MEAEVGNIRFYIKMPQAVQLDLKGCQLYFICFAVRFLFKAKANSVSGSRVSTRTSSTAVIKWDRSCAEEMGKARTGFRQRVQAASTSALCGKVGQETCLAWPRTVEGVLAGPLRILGIF